MKYLKFTSAAASAEELRIKPYAILVVLMTFYCTLNNDKSYSNLTHERKEKEDTSALFYFYLTSEVNTKRTISIPLLSVAISLAVPDTKTG